MEAEYIALYQSLRERVGVCEILKEIQTYVIPDQTKKTIFCTHTLTQTFTLDHFSTSIIQENNYTCLELATMPKMFPRTKHINLPYNLF